MDSRGIHVSVRVRAVTCEDIARAHRRFLSPRKMLVLFILRGRPANSTRRTLRRVAG